MLKVANLTKSFHDHPVLKGINLTVERSEIVCIHGRSGEGKTTLLRLLNGLETIDSGTIVIEGTVGMVFQDYQLFPHLDVWDNLMLAPRLKKMASESILSEHANALLVSLNMMDRKHYFPYQLSGGQKQRIAVARACMLNPTLLCFDEPTAALDEESIDDMIKMIKDLAKKGMGILVITHDPGFARNVGDRILHLENGLLVSKASHHDPA